MKKILLLFLISITFSLSIYSSDNDSLKHIKVHFLYGSKPAKCCKDTESKVFGGIKGGHVSIEIEKFNISFLPNGSFHVFPHNINKHGEFVTYPLKFWLSDTTNVKYLTFIIPVDTQQYLNLKKVLLSYVRNSPYDYSFFGMRCAAATYDALAQAGILEKRSRFCTVYHFFYPKLLRNKLFKIYKEKAYEIVYHDGEKSRKWEKDRRKFIDNYE